MKKNCFLLALALAFPLRAQQVAVESDLLVYGATAGGVMAAVQGAKLGLKVILVEPGAHVGGMTASGLGATDIGRDYTIGGLSREFYKRLHAYYLRPEAWKSEDRASFAKRHPDAIKERLKMHFFFEPSVAEKLFNTFLAEAGARVVFNERMDRSTPVSGVVMDGKRIVALRAESGGLYKARMFIDCTYEGDLMAAAGVSFVIGRESVEAYNERFTSGPRKGEAIAGVLPLPADPKIAKWLPHGLDPFVKHGDPASGLLPGVEAALQGKHGGADRRSQAYTFRVCLTDDADNRVEIAKPARYNPAAYELHARYIAWKPDMFPGKSLVKLTPMPNRKTDSNNNGAFSTDFVGHSHEWAEASYARREEIWREHRDYVQGCLWFLANDARVPAKIRAEMKRWGLAKDEFADSENWPFQLYIREARRMVSDYVITQHDCELRKSADDSVGLASYAMDSHQVARFVDAETGKLRFEGAFYQSSKPYPVSYRAIVPKVGECENLLVPVCASASHVA
ncbi:MAG: FAD-dependent oxidoreductase, partial [Opitutaceae bacterium]|nr:FAD-dependent oxidoreductase [Opitutaceae bacterium]